MHFVRALFSVWLLASLAQAQTPRAPRLVAGFTGTATDVLRNPMYAHNPAALWEATTQGYGVHGALRIGSTPEYVTAYNYARSHAAAFATNQQSWACTVTFCIRQDVGRAQTLIAKSEPTKHEFKLFVDTDFKAKLLLSSVSGAESAQVTSAASIVVGKTHKLCCGYDAGNRIAFLSVDAAPTATASIQFIPGSGDSPLCVGWHLPWSTLHAFHGDIDSFGWLPGRIFTAAEQAFLLGGRTWSEVAAAGFSSGFSDWYDFGNADVYSVGETCWDWQISSTGSGRNLEPVVGALQGTPYCVKGLVGANAVTDTADTALRYDDMTGHGYDMEQPWRIMRPGWHSQAFFGTPAFFFPGEYIPAWNYSQGHMIESFKLGPLLSGVNKSWSAAWIYKAMPHTQQNPPDDFLGLTLGGTNSRGWVPWELHGQNPRIPNNAGHSFKFSLNEHYNPIWAGQVGKWVSRRQDDDGTRRNQSPAFAGVMDYTSWHNVVYVFDNGVSKAWQDGQMIMSVDQTVNNVNNNGPLGQMTIRSFSLGGGCYGRDEMVFSPQYDQFSGGGWAWCGWQKAAAVWTGALSDQAAAGLSQQLTNYIQAASSQ